MRTLTGSPSVRLINVISRSCEDGTRSRKANNQWFHAGRLYLRILRQDVEPGDDAGQGQGTATIALGELSARPMNDP